MFRVPDNLLDKLKCSICAGYLNSAPVVAKNGFQICSKCYKILPQNEKNQCVRQISYEALGTCLVFPCRYHKMGCDYTFAFDSDGAHELTCEKKYLGFPDLMKTNIGETTDTNSHNIDQLYDIPITTPVPHHVEKNVQTIPPSAENTQETTPALEINNNQTPRLYENFYESISTLPVIQKKCLNCMNMVEAGNYTVCFFKHISCKTCQKDMCIACVRNLDGSSKVACKNAWKGCKEILATGDVSSHRDNCEFNTIKCPIDSCGYKGVMELLKTHLIDTHQEALISSNEMSKNMNHKDKVFIFLCYGGIFKCSY